MTRKKTVGALVAAGLITAAVGAVPRPSSAAVATPPPNGTWLGVLKAHGVDLHVAVRLEGDAHALRGVFDSLDQGALGLPLQDVKLTDGVLAFAVPSANASYEGAWSAAAGRFEGTWRQGAQALPLALTHGEIAKKALIAGLDGTWDGFLDVGVMGRLRMVLTVRSKDGETTATFQSPDQSPAAYPVTTISRTGDDVVAEITPIKGRFEAVVSNDGRVLAGRWIKNGAPLALALAKRGPGAEAPAERPRPQTPKPPFPYLSIDVGYENLKARNHLAGTLTLPQGKGPFAAALLITGSGLQDRDETILGHKPFLVIADYLTRRGIAVLRVDDRTMGGSTGDVTHATSADFATDVEAGVAFLKTRPEIDPRRIGLIGHSEGGMIAPMVAAKDPSIAFIVLMAGPGLKGAAIILEQQRLINLAMKTPKEKLAKDQALQSKLIDAVLAAPDAAAAHKAALGALAPEGLPPAQAEAAATQVSSDWFRYFLRYDPVPALKRVRVPVLALNGSLDLQVPADANLAAIRQALAHNPHAVEIELAGLNHLFQTAKTGAPNEYNEIEETIAPAALTTLGDWLVAQTQGSKAL
jgi:pimeloyl-ACP methyl ester carboxylesterase